MVFDLTVLVETDVLRLLTEALTADVHTVLADKTSAVGANAASTGALAVSARAAVPHGLVSHLELIRRRGKPGGLTVFGQADCRRRRAMLSII